MDTSRIGSDAVELLSTLTGKKLTKSHLVPSVVFMTALVSLIMGVIRADGEISNEEKQQFQIMLTDLIPPESKFTQFIKIISQSVEAYKTYQNLDHLVALTHPLSEEERLLLISLAYDISSSDGHLHPREKKYLQIISNALKIKRDYLENLELIFDNQSIKNQQILNQLCALLDPCRFESTDPILVKAAHYILKRFPSFHQFSEPDNHLVINFELFQKFQGQCKEIETKIQDLIILINEGVDRNILDIHIQQKLQELLNKIKIQRFRIAIVGEFSQGKSTLLNAWLGEEIQPVRANPCTATITVLKHGLQKRVTCHYRDGRKQVIPFEKYPEKATISEDDAFNHLTTELAHQEINEIIVEHPELNLCKNGVEIVDSPGLNEHPNRTAITQKLIEETDAIIFLTNACRSLSQGERELIEDLRIQLNRGRKDEPAENLFVAVNFMDMLRKESDRQGVQQRVERFFQGQKPVIKGENRIHFISAQAFLDFRLYGIENDYVQPFLNFTQAIENFLTSERGTLKIKQINHELNNLVEMTNMEMAQFEKIMAGQVQLSEQDQQKIFDEIGVVTGRYVNIQTEINQRLEESLEAASKLWEEWVENLGNRLSDKMETWESKADDKQEIIKDYAKKFGEDFSKDFQEHFEQKLISNILKNQLSFLDLLINKNIDAIKNSLNALDTQVGSELSSQFNASLPNIENNVDLSLSISNQDSGGATAWVSLGGGGLVAALLAVFTGGLLIPIALGSAASGLLGLLFGENLKQKVLDQGLEKFNECAPEIGERISTKIISLFNDRIESFSQIVEQAILILEKLVEQQDLVSQQNIELGEANKLWLNQKRQELQQFQTNLNQSYIEMTNHCK